LSHFTHDGVLDFETAIATAMVADELAENQQVAHFPSTLGVKVKDSP
jgi:hypothetical protein